jgi:hypothetical protein
MMEHESERSKQHKLLQQFLRTDKGIPFAQLFAMKQYPHDIYPLYAQGYSLARFLVMQGGRQHFVNYVDAGMRAERPGNEPRAWDAATKKFYGYSDLSELQVRWVHWVKQGCPDISKSVASHDQDPSTSSNELIGPSVPSADAPLHSLASADASIDALPSVAKAREGGNAMNRAIDAQTNASPTSPSGSSRRGATAGLSWYVSQASPTSAERSSETPPSRPEPRIDATDDRYRPGSIRDGQPIEILATITPTSVSANRLNSTSNYFARPIILSENPVAGSTWR